MDSVKDDQSDFLLRVATYLFEVDDNSNLTQLQKETFSPKFRESKPIYLNDS